MQFRNKSDDDRELTLDGVTLTTVPRGDTLVVTADEAGGFALQCGPDGAWEPADDEATAAVEAATAPPADEAENAEASEEESTPPAAPKVAAKTPRMKRSAE